MANYAFDQKCEKYMRCIKCGWSAVPGPPPLHDKTCTCGSERVQRPIRVLETTYDHLENSFGTNTGAFLMDGRACETDVAGNSDLKVRAFAEKDKHENSSLLDNFSRSDEIERTTGRRKQSRKMAPIAANKIVSIGPHLPATFKIVETLGHGDMGIVYRVRDDKAERELAVKVMRPEYSVDRHAIRRFKKEAAAISELTHPNIAQVYGFATTEAPYMVMEFVDGVSLREVLDHERCLSVERTVNIVMQIAEGLEYAHDKGILHRDLKPGNVLIIDGESNEYIKLIDFGMAKLNPTNEGAYALAPHGAFFGSPGYMSPEQAYGCLPEPSSDLYSLGCIMYEMLTGLPVFRGENARNLMLSHLETPINDRLRELNVRRVPSSIIHINAKLLEKDARRRYRSARELILDLRRVQNGQLPLTLMKRKVALIIAIAVLLFVSIRLVTAFCEYRLQLLF